MTITIEGHSFSNELERLSRLFFPDESIRVISDDEPHDELHATVSLICRENGGEARAVLFCGESRTEAVRTLFADQMEDKTVRELTLADALFELLCGLTGYEPPWGMLTGVRPVKLLRMLCDSMGGERAKERMTGLYRCSEEKYKLCADTMEHEYPIIEQSKSDSFSLYISIPFCPTRCSYCSFVSQSIERAAGLLPEYVERLIEEISETAKVAKAVGLRLETVYMGGGTPTTLSAEQMGRVLDAVAQNFDLSGLREYTVEAGRPDTVTPEKLRAIKERGVGRISINPQTLSDEVLHNIGRRHSAAQVYEAMDMAHAVGFDTINMDMIAGLPGDTVESFRASLEGVLSMHPENVTVHTLSMKRASTMVTAATCRPDAEGRSVAEMLSHCSDVLPQRGFHPYYLYRQTRMLGNLENVGWSLDGHDGFYNVYIMDETHTILAVGAGGVTKLRQPGVNNIERIYNFKFPYEYNGRFDEMIARKKAVIEFYEKFS